MRQVSKRTKLLLMIFLAGSATIIIMCCSPSRFRKTSVKETNITTKKVNFDDDPKSALLSLKKKFYMSESEDMVSYAVCDFYALIVLDD